MSGLGWSDFAPELQNQRYCHRSGNASETNTLVDALSRVAESGVTPEGLGSARQGLLAKRGAEAWTFLNRLKDTL